VLGRVIILNLCLAATSVVALAQDARQTSDQGQQKPAVRVNVLNVCTPSAAEQKEIAGALSRIPRNPHWGPDFEVDRGRTTLPDQPDLVGRLAPGKNALPRSHPTMQDQSASSPISFWARIRREFAGDSPFLNSQYAFSADSHQMLETLVFRLRDPKDLLQISIEDSVSSISQPSVVLATDTPASHIRLERFGKASVVLARCDANTVGHAVDQSAYEPLFRSASSILSTYRDALDVRHTVPSELARVSSAFSAGSGTTQKRRTSGPH
jgi:hypothetical protein